MSMTNIAAMPFTIVDIITPVRAVEILRNAIKLYGPCGDCGSAGCEAMVEALQLTAGVVMEDLDIGLRAM
jgi:hypothetical protein